MASLFAVWLVFFCFMHFALIVASLVLSAIVQSIAWKDSTLTIRYQMVR